MTLNYSSRTTAHVISNITYVYNILGMMCSHAKASPLRLGNKYKFNRGRARRCQYGSFEQLTAAADENGKTFWFCADAEKSKVVLRSQKTLHYESVNFDNKKRFFRWIFREIKNVLIAGKFVDFLFCFVQHDCSII